MLEGVQEVLCKDEYDIGKADVTPHKIELLNYSPIWQKPRRFADPVNKEIERQCQQLELQDIVEKSNSRWSSPVVP